MKKPSFSRKDLMCISFLLVSKIVFAQAPANDNCANAITLSTDSVCTAGVNSLTGQTLTNATADGGSITTSCTAVNSQDVWYKFTAQSLRPTVTLSNLGSSWGNRLKIQMLSGSCGSFTEVACGNNTTPLATFSVTPGADLTLGNTYYIRIHKNNLTAPTGSNWGFDICLTGTTMGRMHEVWQRQVLSSATLNTPWEVTYGPDNYLWVTESKGYKAYRIDPNTGASTTILDISNGSATSELTSGEHTTFNCQFTSAQNPWPQGGFAGLAIHPQFNSGKPYVYISYVLKYNGGSSGPGYFFTNALVRFTYDGVSGKLKNPVMMCDTLPGSSDHNSQRLIIAPVGGTDYLFYPQGDMGAGQLSNNLRTNKAQDMSSYEGKILRFNLEPDGDAGAYDKWIPDDNPYNGGSESAIWCTGIRNNQGFAYDTTLGILYGSSHGPYSDDEINIIERGKNYGHPYVIGYAADGNYNGSSAGTPNYGPSTLAVISNEVTAAAAIPNYKDPLFCGYAPIRDTVNKIWTTNPTNKTWPSEAWSGMDIYKNTLIPGWKNSLLVCGLKWGRVLRLKLGPTGTTIVPTNGADTVAYFQGRNRYRDLAIDPNGRSLYISNEGTSATGPGGISVPATVPNCNNCIIKYTFLGYAPDASGKSTIPDAIDVTAGTANSCIAGTTITIDNTNNNLWVPITGPDGNIMAEIYPNGNNLGMVTSSFYTNSGAIRVKSSVHYLDRNITITPQTQPSSTVKIRLYISKAEFDALDADPLGGVNAITDLKIIKNSDPCGSSIASSTALINPTVAEAHGTNGYVLQGDINSFSTFYFSSSNVILPVRLITFTGTLQDNVALLKWVTTNEVNVSHFEVERSINGVDFTKISSETAVGNNDSKNNYSYTDYDAANQGCSVVYYRLKIVDDNGTASYSQILSLTIPASNTFTVRPNPVKQTLYVHGKKDFAKPIQVELYDLSGKILLSNLEFKNDFSIDVTSLKTGVYILKLNNGYDVEQQVYKVIKQ
ncbi:MAG: PQQ-dependent sugar dehydrogenase [Bacteroidetes bacterium]|nr:PQQ-dependent sugar dehydrogenase [Bacteroidota bacterium]MBS1931030.1 PQQ-dependent sugar dehydrogenase [Bacteroidota bacterium]